MFQLSNRLRLTTGLSHWCKRATWRLPVLVLLLSGSSLAAPDIPPPSNIDVARSIAVSGREAFDAGDYETAVALFQRAYALFQAPTLVLYEARALKQMGKLIASEEAYQRAANLSVANDAPSQFTTAIETARVEGLALAESIPTLTIRIAGADATDTRLRITRNGNPVSPLTLGAANKLDPGDYRIEASLGNNRSDTLDEHIAIRQHKMVVLNLTAPIVLAPPPNPLVDTQPKTVTPLPLVMTYVSAGLGVAGLGTGVVAGMLAKDRYTDAQDLCESGCTVGSEGAEAVSKFRSMRTASTIAYGVGAAGTVGSLLFWLAFPKARPNSSTASIEPWLTTRSAGIRGHF